MIGFPTPVFKTGAFNHSAILPRHKNGRFYRRIHFFANIPKLFMEPIEFDRALSSLLSEDDPLRVRFERWHRFLQRELTFSHSESVCHTTEHVERVLLFALLLGRELEVSSDDLDALALCAVFHDTRRHDDDLDVGHGDRAAAYYREYASAHGLNVDDRVERIIARHDRHDRISEEKFRKEGADDETLLLYRIFKDADAIDRFRFGPKALNERYLRTSAARNLLPVLRPFVLRLTGYEA